MRTSACILLALAACAGVSPRPADADVDSLPRRDLTGAEAVRVDDLLRACVDDIDHRRFDDAETHAEAALALDPRAARALAVTGLVGLQRANATDPPDLERRNAAETATVLAERLAPDDAVVAWLRARFLADTGHLSAAAAAAEDGLARTTAAAPDDRSRLFDLAGTYRYELGEERLALPWLQAFVGTPRGAESTAAHFRIGSSLLRQAMLPMGPRKRQDSVAQSQAEQAARAFQRCWDLAPGDDDAALAIGASLLRAAELAGKQGERADRERLLGEAAASFAQVAERFPRVAEAMFRIGVVAEERGETAAAVAAYDGALARDPDHLGALLNLAALRTAAGDDAGADELLRRVLATDGRRGGLSGDERRRIAARLDQTPRML
ncbi:MAG: tetratricopeptide repeat protein [Planctomycetes bacterium]|nr:tetratricopeptide repeat protein [Planctomycetota bacterium]